MNVLAAPEDDRPKLPVITTVIGSWVFLFRHWRDLWRLLWPPIVTTLAIFFAFLFTPMGISMLVGSQSDTIGLGWIVLAATLIVEALLVFYFLAVAMTHWQRYVVLDDFPHRLRDRVKLRKWGLVFILLLLCIGVFFAGRSILTWKNPYLYGVTHAVFPTIVRGDFAAHVLLSFALTAAILAFVLRISLFLPIVSTDAPRSLAQAWSVAKGNGLRLMSIVMLAAMSFWLPVHLVDIAYGYGMRLLYSSAQLTLPSFYQFFEPLGAAGTVLYFIGSTTERLVSVALPVLLAGVFAATVLSLCYRHLAGLENEGLSETDSPDSATANP